MKLTSRMSGNKLMEAASYIERLRLSSSDSVFSSESGSSSGDGDMVMNMKR